jgi:hypothetical protein
MRFHSFQRICRELFFEQERTVERLVGVLDFVQQRQLLDRLLVG